MKLQLYEVYQKQLDDVISQIDSHFVNTLKKHEVSFIKAYKSQMCKVEKELKFLKNKKEEQAGKLMKDDDITNLQASIAWFKSEAVKLNIILDCQKNQMSKSKYNLKENDKEKKTLTDHLKETRRQNKLMHLATEKTIE